MNYSEENLPESHKDYFRQVDFLADDHNYQFSFRDTEFIIGYQEMKTVNLSFGNVVDLFNAIKYYSIQESLYEGEGVTYLEFKSHDDDAVKKMIKLNCKRDDGKEQVNPGLDFFSLQNVYYNAGNRTEKESPFFMIGRKNIEAFLNLQGKIFKFMETEMVFQKGLSESIGYISDVYAYERKKQILSFLPFYKINQPDESSHIEMFLENFWYTSICRKRVEDSDCLTSYIKHTNNLNLIMRNDYYRNRLIRAMATRIDEEKRKFFQRSSELPSIYFR